MDNRTAQVIGLVVEQMRVFFTPQQKVPPVGGGTIVIHIVAGDAVPPPEWIGGENCQGCDPYIWVRLVRRYRSQDFPSEASGPVKCTVRPVIVIEAGVSRCAPMEMSAADEELQAWTQWDDSWRIDRALCAAMKAAETAGAAVNTNLGEGLPFGPEGLAIGWTQTASAQL